jgi:putative membrane protein
MPFLMSLLLGTIAVFVTAYILPGVKIEGWTTALILAIVLGIINAFIRPILLLLTLPINILTLGLFTFVIIALCVMLASAITPGFHAEKRSFSALSVFQKHLTLIRKKICKDI